MRRIAPKPTSASTLANGEVSANRSSIYAHAMAPDLTRSQGTDARQNHCRLSPFEREHRLTTAPFES
jgi:hypothetical protein